MGSKAQEKSMAALNLKIIVKSVNRGVDSSCISVATVVQTHTYQEVLGGFLSNIGGP